MNDNPISDSHSICINSFLIQILRYRMEVCLHHLFRLWIGIADFHEAISILKDYLKQYVSRKSHHRIEQLFLIIFLLNPK